MDTFHFRTAVGGFHKGDVAAYISKTAAAHQAELKLLNDELQRLLEENATLKNENAILHDQLLHMVPVQQADEMPDEPDVSEIPDIMEVPEELHVGQPPVDEPSQKDESLEKLELAAYRRAEAAERIANLRAKKLYEEMGMICADASCNADKAKTSAQEELDAMLDHMKAIETYYRCLTSSMHTAQEKLLAMGNMVPDPAETLED